MRGISTFFSFSGNYNCGTNSVVPVHNIENSQVEVSVNQFLNYLFGVFPGDS